MKNAAILYAVPALIGWTLLVLILVPMVRVRAVMRRQLFEDDFRYGESSPVPARLRLPNRNYMNLLALPILFYVVCLIAYAAKGVTPLMLVLAWCFVALRVAHSAIHLAYDKVLHRLTVFGLASAILAVQLILTRVVLLENA